MALGWTDGDQRIYDNPDAAKSWNALVDIPKPLTGRSTYGFAAVLMYGLKRLCSTAWANLLVKLTPLLEENRVRRLAREKEERRIERRRCLQKLLVNVKDTAHPFSAAIEVLAPGQGAETHSTPRLSHFDFVPTPRRHSTVVNPFPPIAIALEWECLKDLGETEISVERVEELFNERREQLDRCLVDWREALEKQLVEIFTARVVTTLSGVPVETADGGTEAEPIVKASFIWYLVRC